MAKPQQFKKDDPRINREGRPKGSKGLTTKLRLALDKIHEGTGTRYDELFVQATLKDGIKTDGQSRRMIFQYLEGMPIQKVDGHLEHTVQVVDPEMKKLIDDEINRQTTPSSEEPSEI